MPIVLIHSGCGKPLWYGSPEKLHTTSKGTDTSWSYGVLGEWDNAITLEEVTHWSGNIHVWWTQWVLWKMVGFGIRWMWLPILSQFRNLSGIFGFLIFSAGHSYLSQRISGGITTLMDLNFWWKIYHADGSEWAWPAHSPPKVLSQHVFLKAWTCFRSFIGSSI